MKYILSFFLIFLLTISEVSAKLPEKIEGENFQRIEKLEDCQYIKIEEFKGIHKQFDTIICFYSAYYMKNGEKIYFTIAIQDYKSITIMK